MRRSKASALVTGGVFLMAAAVGTASLKLGGVGTGMKEHANAFLESLEPDQRQTATIEFDDPRRLDWNYLPLSNRKGLPLRAMNEQQKRRAHTLLQSALSEAGYEKVTDVIELEEILYELSDGAERRHPGRFYFTLFGTPSEEGRWGLSVEGHHLSVNFVVEDGQLASHTPAFLGTNPAVVAHDHGTGLKPGHRTLKREETAAFELLNALDDEQRETAIFRSEALNDVRGGGDPQPPSTEPVGLPASEMNAKQQELFRELIHVYLDYMPRAIADWRWDQIQEAGFENLHFGWAGAREPGKGHYYRIQGPTMLVELANTQPGVEGRPANHVHALWRDMRGDFGLKK